MDPLSLVELCVDSIRRWESDEIRSERPTVLLVVPCARRPSGDGIRLFGSRGPRGRIATVRDTPRGYDVAAYFPAATVADAIAAALGVPSPVRVASVASQVG